MKQKKIGLRFSQFISKGEPNFDILFNPKALSLLEKTIAEHNKNSPLLIIEGKKFSFNNLVEFKEEAIQKYTEIKSRIKDDIRDFIKREKPDLSVKDLEKEVDKIASKKVSREYFGSLNKTFKTLKK